MRKIRNCTSARLNTGGSKCEIPYDKLLGAIVVPYGTKLPIDTLTGDSLEALAHADVATRVYGIRTFVDASKEGGEVQTSAQGYGPEKITGYSARKDTMTMDEYSAALDASISKAGNRRWGVYYYDCDCILYGISDGSDTLAPFPLNNMYSNSTPFKTSSNPAQLTVTFSHEDAKKSKEKADFVQLDFDPQDVENLGLTEVVLTKTTDGGTAYKLIEKVGSNDVTAIYGPLIVASADKVLKGLAEEDGKTVAVTYNESANTLTITGTDVALQSPSVLYKNGIKGIEQVS